MKVNMLGVVSRITLMILSKDNPKVVIEIARKWKGLSSETDKLVKHGCRTLLKQGSPKVIK